jgi:hypothetical protein
LLKSIRIRSLGLLIGFATLVFLIVSCQQEKTVTQDNEPETFVPTPISTETSIPITRTRNSTTATPPARATAVPTAISTATPGIISSPIDGPGALVQLTMQSQAGLLLDELPEEMRDRVADELGRKPESFWQDIARQQVELTYNRLHFRPFFYAGKGQLPWPPESLWEITLADDAPRRQTVDGHDLLLIDYTFTSLLLTDTNSPGTAEPALAETGGIWDEPFVLPLDPTLLLQRTGNACLNEGGFPPNSYDSENASIFYDYSCTANSGGAVGCHRTQLSLYGCREALDLFVGKIETIMRFERLPWDPDLADQVRVVDVQHLDAPDLLVVEEDLNNTRVIYRYFAPNSCAVAEQCITGTGWRRLLQFDANAHNLGAAPLTIGPVAAENPLHNMFQYNSCHDHFHFSNYGSFQFGVTNQPSKQAFCVESTSRFSNNELSPLTHNYSCRNQGIQAGWVDEYGAGLDCQWIDITDIITGTTPVTLPLSFRFNEERFLCEGKPVLDENGNPLFEPSGQRTETGLPISRPQCEYVDDWEANNAASQDITIAPSGSFVTAPCTHGQLGPLRNCGFSELPLPPLPEPDEDEEEERPLRCTPGGTVQLSCSLDSNEDTPQVLRVCETSAALGVGTACTHADALLNTIISNEPATISFTCPLPRDANEPGGDYAIYTGAVFTDDATTAVTCTLQ